MRRNDFFKYLLLGGGGSASRSELESETLPYTFVSKSQRLRNYRIYGNTVDGESVGDLVETGEHTGEYCVPATITNGTITKTANIYLPEQLRKVGNESEYIDYKKQKQYRVRKNLFNPSNITPNINLSSTTGLPTKYIGRIGISIPILTNGNVTLSYRTNNNININFMYTIFRNDTFIARTVDKSNGDTINCENGDKIYIAFYIEGTSVSMNDISNIMLNPGTEVLSYESYIEDTELDVTLPALPILEGTNTLSIGTTVQPSKVYLKGNISENEVTISRQVQTLQTNMRSLQPLSFDDEDLEIDVMPTDNDLQLDVKPIEKPVLNLNNVSEIENAEIERGVESAE